MPDDWRAIAAQVVAESDPKKLTSLLTKLCEALDKRTRQVLPDPRNDDAARS